MIKIMNVNKIVIMKTINKLNKLKVKIKKER
jgi:hypothetical protein